MRYLIGKSRRYRVDTRILVSRSDIISLHHKTVACLFFVVGEVIDKHHFLYSLLQASQALQAGFTI